jgi:flavin reductase (DIM6/NTAB) family NADH-FMN oxidoreductase RutF
MEKVTLGPRTLLCPMPVAVVGALVGDRPNYMVATYCGIAQHDPPMISVSLNKTHYTNAGIRGAGAFSVNIPSADLAERVDHCGIVSGRTEDKSVCFASFYGRLECAPMAAQCPLNLECRLVMVLDLLGTNELFIGEIAEVYANSDVVTDGTVAIERLDPLAFTIADNAYRRLGTLVGRAWEIGRCAMRPAEE